MEPMSALSVATSVIQFVDFASKLFLESKKIYDGRLEFEEHADLRHITRTLSDLSRELQHPPKTGPSSPHIGDLHLICQDANRVANELIKELDSIRLDAKNKGKLWESCLLALKSRWKKEHIDELQQRI